MKRAGYLFEKIVSKDNIILAIHNATKNKKKKRGIVKDAAERPEHYAEKIREKLINGTYYFAPPILKTRREHKKVRHIKVPKFYPDQIIHWALMQIIEPIITKGMYRFNCGSVPTRGGLEAKRYVERALKDEKIRYVAKLDISKFFNSVKPKYLMEMFRRKIKDEETLGLIQAILINGGDQLPIGYYTSQWFSNFFLEGFDHYVKEELKIKYYVRYVDDMVLIDTNKRKLRKAIEQMNEYLRRIGL